MKKLVNDVKSITIEELVDRLSFSTENLCVYYRSNNKRESSPRFLKIETPHSQLKKASFFSPFVFQSETYSKSGVSLVDVVRSCLHEASKNRQIYVLEYSEVDKIFKVQI